MAESTRIELPLTPRPRRKHAERTAETRARIISAVIESIAEVGFQRTTAQEIAARSGVTWGAVQHHFGGKEGILVAVLEDSFNHFAERLGDLEADGAALDERVHLFVERAWEHFRSPHYRTAFEILLSYLGPQASPDQGAWRRQMFTAWNEIWGRVFADATLPRSRDLMLQHYTISVLSGLASTLMLAGTGAELPAEELRLLEATLVRELSAA